MWGRKPKPNAPANQAQPLTLLIAALLMANQF
jgi:hypothetical protein